MTEIDTYIASVDGNLRGLVERVRAVTKGTLPNAKESIRMGLPTYSIDGVGIACIADYSRHINLYLFSGAKLSSPLLEGTGKGMRHIKVRRTQDIREAEFARLLKAAAKLAANPKTGAPPGPRVRVTPG